MSASLSSSGTVATVDCVINVNAFGGCFVAIAATGELVGADGVMVVDVTEFSVAVTAACRCWWRLVFFRSRLSCRCRCWYAWTSASVMKMMGSCCLRGRQCRGAC